MLVALLIGCGKKVLDQPTPSTPPPVYTGPPFLRGTVGSMTRLRGAHTQLVSGFGLVVNLPGTGSSEVPAYLRQWMLNQMRKRGVGSARLGTQWMTPEQVLASPNTAVVMTQGLIPPGAVKGTRFDVMVSALPQTQTTSLEGGQLWTVDLSLQGADPSMRFSQKLASARGPLFLDPLARSEEGLSAEPLERRAVVLSGGVATAERKLELVLNQASWQRSRMIADRINERFPKAPSDRRDTAVPINDSLIELNIPARFNHDTMDLLGLIRHLYTQRGPRFEPQQAQRLADLLAGDGRHARSVVLAWQAMGKTVLPVIRPYYDHPQMDVCLAALEAGARLEDEMTTDPLNTIAKQPDPALRRRAAQVLARLPRSLRAARTLHTLLDDPDTAVRIQAYESLATIRDPILQRVAIGEREEFKFVLDIVPAMKPLIYIAQTGLPRVVVFNPDATFNTPFVARMWDNRLMIRASGPRAAMTVFYQPQGQIEGRTFEITPLVRDLVLFLAHRPTQSAPDDGLDLSFSQVTDVLHQLSRQDLVGAELEVQLNPLAAAIAKASKIDTSRPRPATAGRTVPPSPDAPGPNPQQADQPTAGTVDEPRDDAPVILLP